MKKAHSNRGKKAVTVAVVFGGILAVVTLLVYQGFLLASAHGTAIGYALLVIVNAALLTLLLRWHRKSQGAAIVKIEEDLKSMAETGEMKSIRLSGADTESKILARFINQLVRSVQRRRLKSKNLSSAKKETFARLIKENEEIKRRAEEAKVLSDISDRIGYSLDIPAIVEIIAGSVGKLLPYTSISYVLLDGDVLRFHVRLEESVSRAYIEEVKSKMIDSLVGLTNNQALKKTPAEEIITGSVIDSTKKSHVVSFFNGPLVIQDETVGLLNVASLGENTFTEAQMNILYTITKKVSSAVELLRTILEEEKGKLNAMVSSISDGLVMVNTNLEVMVVNPALKIMLDLAVVDVSILDIVEKLRDTLDVRFKLQETLTEDKLMAVHDIMLGQLYVRPIFSPVRDIDGSKLGVVMLLQDVTHEHEIQRIREDFTSMMVHELRSPLDNIKKMAEVMRLNKKAKRTKNDEEYLQLMFKNSSQMLELVNDLLDVAKLEAGEFDIFKRSANIGEIIRQRVSFFATAAKDAKIKLTSAGNISGQQKVLFDEMRIAQVLNNLISNAVKFTEPAGTVTVQVLLHKAGVDLMRESQAAGITWFLPVAEEQVRQLPDSLIIAVTDTGVGVPKDVIPELFGKFKQFQRSAVSDKQKGTGLGLAISKGIIEAHNGTIGVGSQEGSGSTFYFTLPMGKKDNKVLKNKQ